MRIVPERLRVKSLPVHLFASRRKSSSDPGQSRSRNTGTREKFEDLDPDLENGYSPESDTAWSPDHLLAQLWKSIVEWKDWHRIQRRSIKFIIWPFLSKSRKIDRKLLELSSGGTLNYKMRKPPSLLWIVGRLIFFGGFTLGVSIWHSNPMMWLPFEATTDESPQLRYIPIVQAFVITAVGFLTAVGQFSTRGARAGMEAVRQAATMAAFYLLKIVEPPILGNLDVEELQLLVYECLALLAAYPVALLHQLHGNNRDPDVMHACQESAPELRRLRQCLRHRSSSAAPSKQKKFDKVKQLSEVQHFFEMFSLRLDKKFRVRGGKGKRPPMIPQKIIYQLRNRLELLKDNQVTDPQRLDFFGNTLNSISLGGKECTVHCYYDKVPAVFLWAVRIGVHILVLSLPIELRDWIATPIAWEEWDGFFRPPDYSKILPIIIIAIICTYGLTLLDEMWSMWDPYGPGVNVHGWTLGIAMEVDALINEAKVHECTSEVAPEEEPGEEPEEEPEDERFWGIRAMSS